MKGILLFLLAFPAISCNNQKIDRLESEVRDIKQSLHRIEILLGKVEHTKNDPVESSKEFKESYDNTYNLPKKYSSPAGRCNAITKKGSQCSRKARSGGYCWQHGG